MLDGPEPVSNNRKRSIKNLAGLPPVGPCHVVPTQLRYMRINGRTGTIPGQIENRAIHTCLRE